MINPYDVVDVIHVANMDEAYVTYAAGDEYLVNHDHDDDTDDDKAWRRRDLLLAGQPAGRPREHITPRGRQGILAICNYRFQNFEKKAYFGRVLEKGSDF